VTYLAAFAPLCWQVALGQDADALARVQREAQQQQAEQALLREENRRSVPSLAPLAPQETDVLGPGFPGAECIDIDVVHFDGATLFSPMRLAALYGERTCGVFTEIT